MSKIFIDTNILIYSMDAHNPQKRDKCRDLLRPLTNENKGVISTQVMQEFYVAATKKLRADALIVKDILRAFERFEIVMITPEMIYSAIDCAILNRLSFWDSLIIVSAEIARCGIIWTEDLNDNQTIRGVRVQNPF
ncbi:MAG: PIN domain nuclease [Deltaproteobacteria bacterium CG_4_8_14_3_um_filter_51_11]|nr:PIN domain-containing protein [bacterium]OIP42464.1 MAG: twitching motility protein PilT [Desulfobacteraceae bacterium CG2_30_51_40]PIP46224.1 MAG: PIN domain nuclease [Deltaproteobacteria bacterium CG23_combo_of_CG06-09_8_20_14_all_51_20]PIV98934.1 MAG: PIN domain nuclease [Deltaproteobacteria bacterium CG17_big_fil_post_rev_8_21_14_2_50_51_6]PIX20705.1 MAG: PIN domain nuclease [Deltaproteobacteria bacterium CG_4_8_14_3_um_filter_51_11]PIY23779.1 MAG: PIN domain nuclease [Deltaproteobacter